MASIRIDARGMRCPWPAIRLARALRQHPGEPIDIAADDPAAERELGQLAAAAGAGIEAHGAPGDTWFRVTP